MLNNPLCVNPSPQRPTRPQLTSADPHRHRRLSCLHKSICFDPDLLSLTSFQHICECGHEKDFTSRINIPQNKAQTVNILLFHRSQQTTSQQQETKDEAQVPHVSTEQHKPQYVHRAPHGCKRQRGINTRLLLLFVFFTYVYIHKVNV